MIDETVSVEIGRRLARVESDHNVRVLLAVESGSRAWGFPSPDSDYDVRFVYVRRPDWYTAIDLEERPDVIEYPILDDIDLNGCNVRKALRLFLRSNPAITEWIQSPHVYASRGPLHEQLQRLLPEVYAVDRGVHHYRSMARSNYRTYLQADVVPLKKYFYGLRPLLAARWVLVHRSAPPIEFERLLTMLESEGIVRSACERLLELKRLTNEIGREPAIPELNAFIEGELAIEPEVAKSPRPGEPLLKLNQLFARVLAEVVF